MTDQFKQLDSGIFDENECQPSKTDVKSADPWSVGLSSEGSYTVSSDLKDFALSSEDFSSMSVEQCEVLAAASDTKCNTSTADKRCTGDFEVDHAYLNKLGGY